LLVNDIHLFFYVFYVTKQQHSTFLEPRIAIYFYSKTNQMHSISNLFYFGSALYMFRTVFPSIIRSLRLYTQHQANFIQVSANYLLTGSWQKPV